MPPVFTRQFARRLDRLSPLRVVEASDGVPLAPGTVHLAPGDHHLVVRANGRSPRTTGLTQGPPENFCRPAVDPPSPPPVPPSTGPGPPGGSTAMAPTGATGPPGAPPPGGPAAA